MHKSVSKGRVLWCVSRIRLVRSLRGNSQYRVHREILGRGRGLGGIRDSESLIDKAAEEHLEGYRDVAEGNQ
jgi:hypothetical protein